MKLVLTSSSGLTTTIDKADIVIGRGLNCDIRFFYPNVSRRHCRIYYRAHRYWLQDLGSLNGTLLNGGTVDHEPVALREGDQIKVGPATFEVSWASAEEPSAV